MALTICWRGDDGRWRCRSVPVLLEPWWAWVLGPPGPGGDPSGPWDASFPGRLRAAVTLLFRKPPNPWPPVGVALSAKARRDLAIVSTIERLAERLSPGVWEALRAPLADAVRRVPLPAGAEAHWNGAAARTRTVSA